MEPTLEEKFDMVEGLIIKSSRMVRTNTMEAEDVAQLLRMKLVKAERAFTWHGEPHVKWQWLSFVKSVIRLGLMEIRETIYRTGRGKLAEGFHQEPERNMLGETLTIYDNEYKSIDWEDLKDRAKDNPVALANLLFFEGKSFQEIADMFGKKPNTIRPMTWGKYKRQAIADIERYMN